MGRAHKRFTKAKCAQIKQRGWIRTLAFSRTNQNKQSQKAKSNGANATSSIKPKQRTYLHNIALWTSKIPALVKHCSLTMSTCTTLTTQNITTKHNHLSPPYRTRHRNHKMVKDLSNCTEFRSHARGSDDASTHTARPLFPSAFPHSGTANPCLHPHAPVPRCALGLNYDPEEKQRFWRAKTALFFRLSLRAWPGQCLRLRN